MAAATRLLEMRGVGLDADGGGAYGELHTRGKLMLLAQRSESRH